MPRTKTDEPLVEIDSDGTYVPAGRQLAPNRPTDDGRDHYGRTTAEEAAFEAAVDRLNAVRLGRPPIDPDTYPTKEESRLMMLEHIDSGAPLEKKLAWLAEYRKDHPLPTSFSSLEPGDPALYVPPAAPTYSGPAAETLIHSDVSAAYSPAPPIPAIRLNPMPSPPAVPLSTVAAVLVPAQPARTFGSLAEAMDTLEDEAKREQVPAQKTAPGVTTAAVPALVPAAPNAHIPATILIEAIELVEAHPEAVTRFVSFVRNLFGHAA